MCALRAGKPRLSPDESFCIRNATKATQQPVLSLEAEPITGSSRRRTLPCKPVATYNPPQTGPRVTPNFFAASFRDIGPGTPKHQQRQTAGANCCPQPASSENPKISAEPP